MSKRVDAEKRKVAERLTEWGKGYQERIRAGMKEFGARMAANAEREARACKTCGGAAWVYTTACGDGEPCPDCTEGYVETIRKDLTRAECEAKALREEFDSLAPLPGQLPEGE